MVLLSLLNVRNMHFDAFTVFVMCQAGSCKCLSIVTVVLKYGYTLKSYSESLKHTGQTPNPEILIQLA